MEAMLRASRTPLGSVESGRALKDFDALGFTLQHEMSFTNILTMLDLGGVPQLASDRTDGDPIVLAGGPAALVPEPLADFIDIFCLGDGEAVNPPLLELLRQTKGKPRRERLRAAAVKLREDDDFVVTRQDVEIPHNEIGELASVFVDMSQTLHKRRQELMHTQEELAHMNQALEKRVEARTRELKKATADLVKAERLVAIGQMASIISHEIRNPLAVISNATRLIKMLVRPTDQKILKQFGIIEAEIRQANSIISEVLGYARTREMILSTVEVNSYVREIALSFPKQPGIVLKEVLDEESVRVKIDAEEIKQALRNLISNAVEAMPNGGTVTVGTKVGKRVVCLYVADEGPGLTEEIRQNMFSPFFTTKARGTGLGLAVVRKAITRHKGKLLIKSELGKGTCFQIYLKIYRRMGDTTYGEAS